MMTVFPNSRGLRGWLIILLIIASPSATASAGEVRDAKDRWIPSAAGLLGVTIQPWDAAVAAEICPDCSFSDPGAPVENLRPPTDGDDNDVSPYVGINLELMTPELSIPGSPRVFIGGEVLGNFGVDRKVAIEQDPGAIRNPIPEAAQATTPFTDENALGQGSQTKATNDRGSYGAYIGLAFPVEVFERDLLIKPTFAWIRFQIDLSGRISDADCQTFAFGSPPNRCNTTTTGGPGFLRTTEISSSITETYNAIGPGLDVEMEIGRWGPVGGSLFTTARFYAVLGDRDVTFEDGPTAISDVLGNDEVLGRFGFRVDPWLYRLGMGVRLMWLGDER